MKEEIIKQCFYRCENCGSSFIHKRKCLEHEKQCCECEIKTEGLIEAKKKIQQERLEEIENCDHEIYFEICGIGFENSTIFKECSCCDLWEEISFDDLEKFYIERYKDNESKKMKKKYTALVHLRF